MDAAPAASPSEQQPHRQSSVRLASAAPKARYFGRVPQRVFLHVGLPKCGSTYLQGVLATHKERLATEAGLLFPGKDWRAQVVAVRDVRAMPTRSERIRSEVQGAWDRLADEIRAWPGDVVVSMEWLCGAQPDQVARIITDLAPATVEVVFTVRDLGRRLPASWQESVQNMRTQGWHDFLDEVARLDPQSLPPDATRPHRFWKLHDTVELVSRWTRHVPVEQVHVVTVPRPGEPPAALWHRFARVLGIDGERFDTESLARNESLDVASTEMLRRLSPRFPDPDLAPKRVLVQNVAKQGLSRRQGQHRLTLPASAHEWVRARAEAEVVGLKAAGVQVHGDLDELRADPGPVVGLQPEELSDAEVLDAALDGLVLAVQGESDAVEQAEAERARLEQRHADLRARHERLRRQLDAWRSRPLRSALRLRARRLRRGTP